MANFKKIKTLAKERNMSLRSLCEQVGITAPGLSLIISSNKTHTETIEKIAQALDSPVGYFFDDENKTQLNDNVMEILRQKDELLRQKDLLLAQKDALIDMLVKKQSK